MGNLTRRTAVLAALCAGALAALLAFRLLQQERARAAAATAKAVPVVAAAQDIPARTVIEPGMVYESFRAPATLPGNCASSLREVVGRVTLAALGTDEPVRRTAIASQTAALGLAYVVPDGMRAVTVAVDSIIGVAGFLKAGDHVDVVGTLDVNRLDGVGVTKTVLQDVELLAIGPEVRPEEVSGHSGKEAARPRVQPNATLAVSPEDAEKLILAESKGKLRLTLRRAGDNRRVLLAGVGSGALFGREGPRASQPQAVSYQAAAPRNVAVNAKAAGPRVETVETIRASKKTAVEVLSD
jgi:pilus assembly protein CpaB